MDKYTLNIGIENHVERIYDNVIIPEIKNIIRDLINIKNIFNMNKGSFLFTCITK